MVMPKCPVENGASSRNLFDLADYNHQNGHIDHYLKEAINLWLDKGIDGIRVDAVKHFPAGWAQVWVDSIYSHRQVFTFGEWFLDANEGDALNYEFANKGGMSLLDFRFGQQLREVLRDGTDDWLGFASMIAESAGAYDEIIDQVTFIDNHDISRFRAPGADTRRTDMALAVLLTSRGVPIVYYGTEQYMTGEGDPENRKKMTSFDRTTRAYRIIQRLATLRQSNPALGYGETRERRISPDVYIYEREFGNNVVLVAINRASAGATEIGGLFTALPAGTYTDVLGGLLDGNAITVNANGSVNSFALGAGEVGVWQATGIASGAAIGHVGPMTGRVGQTVTIDGEGFGTSPGTVRFNTAAATVLAWSDNQVKARVPGVAAGFYDIAVTPAGGTASAPYDKFEVLTGKQVPVRFIVNNAATVFGQNVYLTGNVSELSDWSTSPDAAVGPFFNQVIRQWPTWYFDVSVPAGRTIEYKFIKLDGAGNVVWEGGGNHVVTTPADGTATIEVEWQN